MNNKLYNKKLPFLPALFLALGLLLSVLALAMVPGLRAQDGNGADDDLPRVYISDSEDDLQDLPPELRERLIREGAFAGKQAADLSGSTKTADRTSVLPAGLVTYTVLVDNSGDFDVYDVEVVDALPADLTYVSHLFEASGVIPDSSDVENNTITWKGSLIAAGGYLKMTIVAKVSDDAVAGSEIENKAVITWPDPENEGEMLKAEPATTITVADSSFVPFHYLPLIYRPVPEITSISASRPNSQNSWTVSWTSSEQTNYEIQESQSPGFENAALIPVGVEANRTFTHQASPYNVYYYRVRSKVGDIISNWSPTVRVVGGYRDDFDSNTTGWDMRRTTHLDNVRTWYEPWDSWHILQVEDRWDLGLASPLKEAPSIPYAIDVVLQSVHPGWQKGLGVVFAGDLAAADCPVDRNTVEGWYEHKDCFNQFYEFMLVEGADKKNLQVQRISEVVWLGPGSGGIPAHRRVARNWYIEKISGVSWENFNRMRIEVYENEIKFYANRPDEPLKLQLVIDENVYPNNAYFGTFATTQEYSNMTGRYEYFEVMPLDN